MILIADSADWLVDVSRARTEGAIGQDAPPCWSRSLEKVLLHDSVSSYGGILVLQTRSLQSIRAIWANMLLLCGPRAAGS